jgi:hypothetical protein
MGVNCTVQVFSKMNTDEYVELLKGLHGLCLFYSKFVMWNDASAVSYTYNSHFAESIAIGIICAAGILTASKDRWVQIERTKLLCRL